MCLLLSVIDGIASQSLYVEALAHNVTALFKDRALDTSYRKGIPLIQQSHLYRKKHTQRHVKTWQGGCHLKAKGRDLGESKLANALILAFSLQKCENQGVVLNQPAYAFVKETQVDSLKPSCAFPQYQMLDLSFTRSHG